MQFHPTLCKAFRLTVHFIEKNWLFVNWAAKFIDGQQSYLFGWQKIYFFGQLFYFFMQLNSFMGSNFSNIKTGVANLRPKKNFLQNYEFSCTNLRQPKKFIAKRGRFFIQNVRDVVYLFRQKFKKIIFQKVFHKLLMNS